MPARSASHYRVKSRHAAALALVGWYLMMPPIESCLSAFNGHRCEEVALIKWKIQQIFDSRAKCETVSADFKEKGQGYLTQAARNLPTGKRMDLDQADPMTWVAAQCIATDDPRLKEK